MTAQETNLFNAFETTLTATMGSSDTTFSVNAVTDSYPTTLSAPFYIVINPDSATNREVILVTAVDTGTKQLTTTILNRYLPGSAASSGLSHSSGQTVRMAPLQQHIEDINDRVDTIINEAGTAVNTSLFLDEDDMVSDSPTKGVTQQSVKAYVDSQVTAQDLDFLGDTGSGAVDLDSQDFTIAGTANEIETSASGQTLTIGLPSSITVNVTGDLTGNVSGDLTGNVTATSVLADGVTATTQSAGDNSTKVATTAYVDALSVDDNLTVSDGTTSTTIDLDTQTFSVLGTANEIETSTTAQTITIGLPANITVNVTGQVSDISNHSTTDLSEGTNLYYTTARFDTAFSGKSTTDLSEGTNLYYTTTRANTDIDARVDKAFVDALNVDADTLDGNDSTAFATSAQGALADSAIQPTDGVGDLADVDTTGVTNGQVLAYNSTSGDFEPADPTTGDITAVNTNANSGLAGGVTSGAADLTLDANNLASTTAVSSDYLVIQDVTDNSTKKALISDIIAAGDIEGVTAGTNLNGGGTSGTVTVNLDSTVTSVALQDYSEVDVAVTSSSGVIAIDMDNGNTGSITLTENITDIDFTNVPASGVATFTLQITQDSTDRTVAINAVTVNGGGDVTAKTAGGAGFTMSTGWCNRLSNLLIFRCRYTTT
jgi:hypothetical protein